MYTIFRRFQVSVAAFVALLLASYAVSAAGQNESNSLLTPELDFRVEASILTNIGLPPGTTLALGARSPSSIDGYDKLTVRYRTSNGNSGTIPLLIATDNSSIAQFNSYDLTSDPAARVPPGNHPSRGGNDRSPVTVVVYDDLECPFCAKLYAELFPAVHDRYKEQVRVVYQSYPLNGHPWAMRAAVDVGCVAKQNDPAYWAAVGYIHDHFADYGVGQESTRARSQRLIDSTVLTQTNRFHLDHAALRSCIERQNTEDVKESIREGEMLGVDSTPTFFINGLRIAGVVPLDYIFQIIDKALLAANSARAAR